MSTLYFNNMTTLYVFVITFSLARCSKQTKAIGTLRLEAMVFDSLLGKTSIIR